jgi:hypothetical protein
MSTDLATLASTYAAKFHACTVLPQHLAEVPKKMPGMNGTRLRRVLVGF